MNTSDVRNSTSNPKSNRHNFGYLLTQEMTIDEARTGIAKKKRRLRSLFTLIDRDGPTCVCCGKVGTKFALGIDNGGAEHWDLYTDAYDALTIDHIHPKSKGGVNCVDNYQIMCKRCNFKKGARLDYPTTSALPGISKISYV
jgi:5-methylcytosine-specific restriction endonuclease McrA